MKPVYRFLTWNYLTIFLWTSLPRGFEPIFLAAREASCTELPPAVMTRFPERTDGLSSLLPPRLGQPRSRQPQPRWKYDLLQLNVIRSYRDSLKRCYPHVFRKQFPLRPPSDITVYEIGFNFASKFAWFLRFNLANSTAEFEWDIWKEINVKLCSDVNSADFSWQPII